jgi:hypothetical protein
MHTCAVSSELRGNGGHPTRVGAWTKPPAGVGGGGRRLGRAVGRPRPCHHTSARLCTAEHNSVHHTSACRRGSAPALRLPPSSGVEHPRAPPQSRGNPPPPPPVPSHPAPPGAGSAHHTPRLWQGDPLSRRARRRRWAAVAMEAPPGGSAAAAPAPPAPPAHAPPPRRASSALGSTAPPSPAASACESVPADGMGSASLSPLSMAAGAPAGAGSEAGFAAGAAYVAPRPSAPGAAGDDAPRAGARLVTSGSCESLPVLALGGGGG